MTKEQRQKLIRFGAEAFGETEQEVQVEVNLLQKYKPMIDLEEIKIVAKDLVDDYNFVEREIKLKKQRAEMEEEESGHMPKRLQKR